MAADLQASFYEDTSLLHPIKASPAHCDDTSPLHLCFIRCVSGGSAVFHWLLLSLITYFNLHKQICSVEHSVIPDFARESSLKPV